MGELYYEKASGFVEKHIGNELVIVPLVGAVAQMDKVFSLNEIGSFIYFLIDEPKTKGEILDKILTDFDVTEEIAKTDLDSFLLKAKEAGIVNIINEVTR
ncbi:PqqD family protein [Carboxylicivirga sp. N1Y90]|uniref:PqqD family protein n=1 Tax=Carboxylicivirga fragile TaxID=3417571 RepID=UPI003D32EB75|nr:PqqD family protein [Marinilabiliaceae bacterium N1Y90]